MKFQNLVSNEVVNVCGIKLNNANVIVSGEVGGRPEGKKFCAKWAHIITECYNENGEQYFTINEGWSLVRSSKKERSTKAKKQQAIPAPAPAPAPATEAKDVPAPAPQHESNEEAVNEQALIAAIKNLRGGAVDITKVREIVAEELKKLAAEDPAKATKVREKVRRATKKEGEVFCEKFERIVAKVSRGQNVYLYGRAGSGKSHTAEQVADALGLDFYGQTTIQFAHDVKGYGDAGGNFQDTPFFKAFSGGGLYFQDEYDRSQPEAVVVLNSALANGWYDFPVIGRVDMHPSFRFMAAGNTLLQGPDEEYTTGQTIDASSRDRFGSFFRVDYSHEVELRIAKGNEDIVDFVEDCRRAIERTGIRHIVSYRATKCMLDEVENERDFVACCEESIFKGLDIDAVREIYGLLENKNNMWAKATYKYINNK